MKKQKIITFSIVFFVVLLFLISFFYAREHKFATDLGVKPSGLLVVDQNGIWSDMSLIENKEKILGNKDDLIVFSVWPESRVSGILSYRGTIKGGYFFEGNILINILDLNKKVLKESNGIAKSDWMTSGPVSFEGNIDFTGLPKGQAYFEIHNDNASGFPEHDKSVLVPIVIQ